MVCLSCDYMQISHKSKERFDDCLFGGGRQNNKPHCPHFLLSIFLGHSRSQSIRLEQPLRIFCWLLPCGPNQLNYVEGSLLMGRFWGRIRLKESLSLNPVYLFFFFLIALDLHCCAWCFSSCGEQGLLSTCGVQASHWGGFSYCRAQALEHGLCCCGM